MVFVMLVHLNIFIFRPKQQINMKLTNIKYDISTLCEKEVNSFELSLNFMQIFQIKDTTASLQSFVYKHAATVF